MLIDTCTDYTDRNIYSEATDELLGGLSFDIVRARVVPTRGADGGWILSQYSVPKEQNCA